MGELVLDYTKKRREFGRDPTAVGFEDSQVQLIGSIESESDLRNCYVERDPNTVILSNIPELSEHSVNTGRVASSGFHMKHVEGGWAREVDPTDPVDFKKWTKRIEKDAYSSPKTVEVMAKMCSDKTRQNNEIDLYERYFEGEDPEQSTEMISTRTKLLFKDPSEQKRAISRLCWHPENPSKIAAAYAIMKFQKMPDELPLESYVWDMHNPNVPDKVLLPTSHLCSIAYNPKISDMLAGGQYNGVISIWDFRKSPGTENIWAPEMCTDIEKSHHDPVYDIVWLHSKTGNELVSTSTDGRVNWWDMRKLDSPSDTMMLFNVDGEKKLGGTRLEYNHEAGPLKYLVGTENGGVVQISKRVKKPTEIVHRYGLEEGKHHGAVYAIQRNPHTNKYFLSVADWTAKIWFEEVNTPLITTKYHTSYLTDGCWSPSKPGLFFLTRQDGWLDVWDYYYRQNEVAFSTKITDVPLTCIAMRGVGRSPGNTAAIGDASGTISLLSLSDSLYKPIPQEKLGITSMLDREFRREKNLEMERKKAGLVKPVKKDGDKAEKKEKAIAERIDKLEAEFFEKIEKRADEVEGGKKGEEKKEEVKKSPTPPPKKEDPAPAKEEKKAEEEKPTEKAKPIDEGESPKEEAKEETKTGEEEKA